MEEWYHYLLLIAVGFTVGFVNTVAGGGSLLSLPVLIFLGLPPAVANGTNRVAIVFQTAMGTAGFKSKGISTFPFNMYLASAAFLGSIVGANIAVDIKGETFNRILAIVMMVVVFIIIFKPKAQEMLMEERTKGKYLVISMIAFFFIGIYGGFINAGIGFIMMIFLHSFNKLSLVKTNMTKVSIACVYTLAALAVFAYNDKIEWLVGGVLAIGNGSGAWVASRYSVKKGDGFIKKFMVVMIVIMAIKLWFFDV